MSGTPLISRPENAFTRNGIGDGTDHVVDAGRKDVGLELGHALLRRAGHRQPLGDLGRAQLDGLVDLPDGEGVEDGGQVGLLDAVSFELVLRHRRQVEGDHDAGRLLGRGRVLAAHPDNPGPEIEVVDVAPGLLGTDAHVLHDVVVVLAGVAEGVVHAVGDLAGELERPRAAHGADLQRDRVLHRPGEREQPRVA